MRFQHRDNIGIMEKKMETDKSDGPLSFIRIIGCIYWDYIGIMEKKMETTI